MKKIIYIFLILNLLSCGENKKNKQSIEQLKQRQEQLKKSKAEINKELEEINQTLLKLEKNNKQNLKNISITHSEYAKINNFISFSANIDSKNNALLVSEFNGKLEKLYVKSGDRVKKGDKIAKINDGGLSEQLEQVKVKAELAKTTFERQERLWKKKIGSEIQYLQAKANKIASEKAVKQLKTTLSKTYITAPFSGIIDNIFIEEGAMVFAGQTRIAQLINLNKMYAKASIPENYIGQVKKNNKVEVFIPVLNKSITGRISKLSNVINPQNRSFYIEVNLDNKNKELKPNLLADIKILNYHKSKGIVIDENVIQETSDGKSYLYVVNKQGNSLVVRKTFVKKGYIQDQKVEIISGLNVGKMVVKEGYQALRDGEKVMIKEN